MLNAPTWGDPARRWRAIPPEEMDPAMNEMKEKSAALFTKYGISMQSIMVETATRERLQAARRNWSRLEDHLIDITNLVIHLLRRGKGQLCQLSKRTSH